MINNDLTQTARGNCDISDARDNGIYSICTLVLKLRNLYKWEHHIEPWAEPETAALLDWIEAKEGFWETIVQHPYQSFFNNSHEISPFDVTAVNTSLADTDLVYGAGYGRSMKAVFFLAEKIDEFAVEGCPVLLLGREYAKELSSPFAMLQDGMIYIRREPLRFFFWDHIQEIRGSSKASLHHALDQYGLLSEGQLNQDRLKAELDIIVDHEIPVFIAHEVGEMLQKTLDSNTLKKIISAFPESAIELVGRALKDILADTHPQGMLHFIVQEQRQASLGFYVGFLIGLRKVLFPEIITAFEAFLQTGDWNVIEAARCQGREKACRLAERMREIANVIDHDPRDQVQRLFNRDILAPLGLDALH